MVLAVAGACFAAAPASAQQVPAVGVVQSQILTIEPDRLFSETLLGQRLTKQVEDAGVALSSENREIEASLTEEESALTEQRKLLPPDQFRALADAFDEKVQQLRREQDAKTRNLTTLTDAARREFFSQVRPVLGRLMAAAGARVILDERTVFASADSVDVTDLAIARINAEIGEGVASDK